VTTVADTLQSITEATRVVESNNSLFRNVSQAAITAIVMGIWGAVVMTIFVWSLWNAAGATEFVCNTPPAQGAAVGTDCTNGWVATAEQLKDVFTFGLLPFVTLVIGFYFGQQATTDV
jgi:hypothetical protein